MGKEPIVIIGGGVGGLTTALCLLQHDVDCVVYERAPELHEVGSGVGLWPSAVRVFDRVGIGERVRALSGDWSVGGVRSQSGKLLSGYRREQFVARFGEPMRGVHRGELQMLLVGALPDGVLRTGHECEGIRVDADRVEVHFADREPVVASVVIAADGNRSLVRRTLFDDKPLRDLGLLGWRGTLVDPPDYGGFAGEIWGNGASFGFLPMSHNRVAWFGAADGNPPATKDFLRERFADWHDPIPAVIEATADDMIWWDRTYDLWPRRHWTRGSVALLGDAAHPMSPFLGQGACQAALDAWVVAEELARASSSDVPRALKRYERRRRNVASAVQLAAHFGCAAARPRPRVVQPLFEASIRALPNALTLRGLHALARGV